MSKSQESKDRRYISIDGRLPGLNEIIGANRGHWASGASLKKEADAKVAHSIHLHAPAPISGAVKIKVIWHDNSRRDPDNIMAGIKFILDALVENGILKNDSKKYVKGIYHDIRSASSEYIEVILYPVLTK
jgi:Holliday junction resolvase RusA-like endonuclease